MSPLPMDPRRSTILQAQWRERFARFFEELFRVRFHGNTSTMISTRKRHGVWEIRLHHMFFQAPDEVLSVLANYLHGGRKGQEKLDGFIETHRHLISRSRHPGRSRGRHFDLARIRDALCRAYFREEIEVPVVWGRPLAGRHRRSVRLGSYSFEDRLIRVHPVLDQDFVPPWVVAGVVYHEMLHHVLGGVEVNGRRRVHTAEFKRRERLFAHHQRAAAWEKVNLDRLLERPSREAKAKNPRMHTDLT